jgi:hypothetical protein
VSDSGSGGCKRKNLTISSTVGAPPATPVCVDGQWYNSVTNTCDLCDADCTKCASIGSKCSECKVGITLSAGRNCVRVNESLEWSLVKTSRKISATYDYSLVFLGTSLITLLPPITAGTLKDYIKVRLSGYTLNSDFSVEFSTQSATRRRRLRNLAAEDQPVYIKGSKISFKVTALNDIQSTQLTVTLEYPNNILVRTTKDAIPQKQASIKIEARSIQQIKDYESIKGGTQIFGATAANSSRAISLALIFGGLCGSNVMFLVKFVQTTEFYSMFIFFNVKYSFLTSSVLTEIFNSLNGRTLDPPTNAIYFRETDHGWIYKEKISDFGVLPFLFSDCGYEVFIVLLLYMLTPIAIKKFR